MRSNGGLDFQKRMWKAGRCGTPEPALANPRGGANVQLSIQGALHDVDNDHQIFGGGYLAQHGDDMWTQDSAGSCPTSSLVWSNESKTACINFEACTSKFSA